MYRRYLTCAPLLQMTTAMTKKQEKQAAKKEAKKVAKKGGNNNDGKTPIPSILVGPFPYTHIQEFAFFADS